MKLSVKQREIVEYIDGAMLVKAGPGSGKTRVLTERVKKLLAVKKRGKVLALTFSNMAAEEMRSRLEKDSTVGDSIERVTISTIHSFCLDIVQSRGYLIGLRSDASLFENENDRLFILRSAIIDEPEYAIIQDRAQKQDNFFSKCLAIISEQKRDLVSPDFCNINEPFPWIYRKYNDVLISQNAMDFDDILFYAYRILAGNPEVVRLYNSVYRYICIDEAQDLNYAQYRVIQTICGENFRNIMMVGDENQSIYAFNGSNKKYMSEFFVRDFSPAPFTLDENFRSAKQIIKFANHLTENKDDITKYVYEGKVSVLPYQNETEEAVKTKLAIENLVLHGHDDIENDLSYGDFAIIARNKYVFSDIENELSKAKIPFYYKKTQSGLICETDYMEAFGLVLRLIMNPMDMYHRQMLCNLVSVKMSELVDYGDIYKLVEQLLSGKYCWLKAILPFVPLDGSINFDKLLNELKSRIPDHLSDEERYLLERDIGEWKKHWNKYKSLVPSESRSLMSFRNAISLGKTQDTAVNSGIALLTAHMSKGLEFEVVFIIGLTEGTFPDYRAVKDGGEAMVQEKNNMYVASTRAKRLCYLSYPENKKMPWGDVRRQIPSRFVRDYSND